jgi:hypothetical protein
MLQHDPLVRTFENMKGERPRQYVTIQLQTVLRARSFLRAIRRLPAVLSRRYDPWFRRGQVFRSPLSGKALELSCSVQA